MGCSLSPKRYVGVRTPSTSGCDYIWIKGIFRGNQVKMRSLRWTLVYWYWCSQIKGKCGHRDHVHRIMPCEDWHDIYCFNQAATRSWERGLESILHWHQREHWPCQHLDFRVLTSRVVKHKCLWFKHHFAVMCMAALQINTPSLIFQFDLRMAPVIELCNGHRHQKSQRILAFLKRE